MGWSSMVRGAAPTALRRNLSLDVTAAIGMGMTMALMSSLLPTVARRQGLDPIGLAVLASAPFLANLLGAFAGRIGPRTARALALLRVGGAALLLLLVVTPVPLLLSAVALGYWLTISFGTPMQHRLWGAMYPARERGLLLGVVATGRTAAAAAAALAGGIIADRIGGPAAIAIGGAIGALCAFSSWGIRTSASESAGGYSFRESWRAYKKAPALRRVAWAQVFYGGGLVAAAPLFALVQVDRLSLSLAEVGTVGLVTALAATLSSLLWGALADRVSGLASIQVGTVLGTVALLTYAVAPSLAFLWLGALLLGLANAAVDMGWPNAIADHTSLEDRAPAAAGLNALTGARGLVAPFLGSLLVQAGLLDVTTALLLCGGASAVGALLYLGMRPSGEPRPWFVRADSTAQGGLRRARSLVVGTALRG